MTLLTTLEALLGEEGDAEQAAEDIVKDVGRLQRSRSYDRNSELTGEFTETTDPTRGTVESLVEGAAQVLAGEVGDDLPVVTHYLAAELLARHAAVLVEIGSEEINEVRLRELKVERDDAHAKLLEAIRDARGGTDPTQSNADWFGALPIISPTVTASQGLPVYPDVLP